MLVIPIVFSLLVPCKRSHVEKQYKTPLSVVVGGGEHGGGIAVPIGNIREVEVVVCDEYDF